MSPHPLSTFSKKTSRFESTVTPKELLLKQTSWTCKKANAFASLRKLAKKYAMRLWRRQDERVVPLVKQVHPCQTHMSQVRMNSPIFTAAFPDAHSYQPRNGQLALRRHVWISALSRICPAAVLRNKYNLSNTQTCRTVRSLQGSSVNRSKSHLRKENSCK